MKVKYINIYECNKAFGGPEEGGWWYDYGHFIDGFPVKPKQIPTAVRRVQNLCDKLNKEENRKPPSSVICDGYYKVYVEDAPGKDFPINPPRYE